jgi:NAD(P)-dependent dehydrogenase (short-subunit alcohol dehydrogenase family)
VADLVADAAQRTVALVNAAGGQAMSFVGDVSNGADVQDMVRAVATAHGRLDCAFNNAGVGSYQVGASGPTHEWTEESFDRMIGINLRGVWLCMKHEIIQMLAQGGGTIVNTSSIAGLAGFPNVSAYVAAKHGVLGLTKAAALEYTDKIRVNAVCPGFIETQMTENVRRQHGEQLTALIPFRRMGTPEEIAEMVLWLCSDRASYVSGACYNVDGGYMAI